MRERGRPDSSLSPPSPPPRRPASAVAATHDGAEEEEEEEEEEEGSIGPITARAFKGGEKAQEVGHAAAAHAHCIAPAARQPEKNWTRDMAPTPMP